MDLTLRWLRGEGIERIVIVTRPGLVEAFRESYRDSVEIVATDSEEFLLPMSDHIFARESIPVLP